MGEAAVVAVAVIVIETVIVAVIETVIVAVHLNVNPTVEVIATAI